MLRHQKSGNCLTVYLHGEIDHCFAERYRETINTLLEDTQITTLILDYSSATFMDSAGVGLIIGRYKRMRSRDGRVLAKHMSPDIERLFRLAGLHRIISIDESGRT